MESREQINKAWADSMLNECTDAMDNEGVIVTPSSLSEYFEKNYELPLSTTAAWTWLAQQSWYSERH